MLREVVGLPSEVLRVPAYGVENIDGEMVRLVDDLVETMYASPGCVGLAAPQIGVSLQLFCVDVSSHKKTKTSHGLVVLFNPVVTYLGERVTSREGCMSVPDLTGDVMRNTQIRVGGLDRDGNEQVVETDAFEARALQHEIDHLNGLLFLDRVHSPSGVFPRKVYR